MKHLVWGSLECRGIRLPSDTKIIRPTLREAKKLFRYCEERAEDLGGVDFAPLALFRQMIQMREGVASLSKMIGVRPILPLLRTMLDCLFSFEYIVCADLKEKRNFGEYRKRSLSWLVFCINQEIALKEMIDISTSRGQAFERELMANCGSIGKDLCSHLKKNSQKDNNSQPLRDRLAKSDLIDLHKEYQTIKPRYFFQLVDPQIRTIEGLAKKVGRWPLYKIFYRPLSAVVHGTDPLRLIQINAAGKTRFVERRTVDREKLYVGLSETTLNLAGAALAAHYLRYYDAS